MKRSGTCPKCKSRSLVTGHDGTQHLDLDGAWEYVTFVCVDCGLEERYYDERVLRYRLERGQLDWVNEKPQGPFR